MGRITGILRPLLRQQQRHQQQIFRRMTISSSSSSFLPSSTSFSPASRTFSSAAGGFLWPNIKKLSDSLPQVGSRSTIQDLGISSVPTRHFRKKAGRGFRSNFETNFGSIRSKADWFHRLRKKKEWFLRLKKKKSFRLLLKSPFLRKLHSSIQEKDLETDKMFGYKKGCLGSSFAERNRMKRHFFHSGILNLFLKEKGMNDKNLNLPQTRSSIESSYKYSHLIYCCASSYQFSMKRKEGRTKNKIKKIDLPTHISEVNYRTLQAVVFYVPSYSELPGYVKRRLGSGAFTTR